MKSAVRLKIFWAVILTSVLAQAQAKRNNAPPGSSPLAPTGRNLRQRIPSPLPQGTLAEPVPVPPPTPPPPSGEGAPPTTTATPPAGNVASGGTVITPEDERPNCEQVRRKAKYGIYFDKVDIEKLVQTVADATCRTFIVGDNIRGKISIIGPENGKVEVNAEQFYAAFLAALDANNLTVYPHGRFLKVVEKQRAKQSTIPTVVDPDAPYTTNEQMITKLFKVRYVEVEQLRGVLQQLISQGGDTIPFPPDTLIVNEIGSNMHRLERIIEQLDSRPSSEEMRVVQLQYATAQEVADKIQKLFESRNQRPGARTGNVATPPPPPGMPAGGMPPSGSGNVGGDTTGSGSGPATLSQLIPDERTNKLIIIASPAAIERIQNLIREIDVPISGEGRINVYYLENANAEELASTLQSLAQGTANKPKAGGVPQPPVMPGQAINSRGVGAVTAAELFSGEVKISADKATNSLVIIASQSDYRSLVRVIERLDIQRRQVFIEAVVMEVNLGRDSSLGVNLHSGLALSSGGETLPGLFATKYTSSGTPPSLSLANLASFSGFLAGIQGPTIPGLNLPAFGVLLHAMQESNDVNVLSTPHILTSDNEEAEITVGQNVPFQSGFSPASLTSTANTAAAVTGQTNLSSIAAGLGGLASQFAPITRQNVELKLTVKPQINESDYVRLVINEQTEEIASTDPVLGPTTAKRSAKTTVVAKDQETIVLGGIMQDRVIENVKKVPVLGNIPILGHLFRETTRKKVKTNLLLILTPYILKDQSDFRKILERKMKERQQFVEMFYGQVSGYELAVDFARKGGPLARMSQAVEREQLKAENGGPGLPGQRVFKPETGATPPPATNAGEPPPLPNELPVTEPIPGQTSPGAREPTPGLNTQPPPPPSAPPPESLEVQPGSAPEMQ